MFQEGLGTFALACLAEAGVGRTFNRVGKFGKFGMNQGKAEGGKRNRGTKRRET